MINKRKVGKHFITEVTGTSFTWRRDQDKIAAEAALDGIYVIRTSVPGNILGAAVVSAYKDNDAAKRNSDKLPVSSYQDLLGHLSTLSRQTIGFAGQKIEKLTTPTPVQARAFELLGAPVPLRSGSHLTSRRRSGHPASLLISTPGQLQDHVSSV